jgi:DNA (cytosine-5)-methyltransferase 1
MSNVPQAVDVFSGCGGMTIGLKRAGFDVVAGVEINEHARLAYSLNHPEVFLFGQDVRALSVETVLAALNITVGELDLMAGCPPCQGFSRMRTKNKTQPVDDSRNDLIFEFIRLVKGLLPKTVMLENVPGLVNDVRFNQALAQLDVAGYSCKYVVVNAADFGVPQRRKRMILVGSRLGELEIAKGRSHHRTVRQAIGKLAAPAQSRSKLHRLLATRSEDVASRIKLIPKDGGSRSAWGEEGQLDCHKKLRGFHDVYGRMAWDKVSPTITRFCCNPSKGRFLHPEQDREISPFEAAILQTFPRSYKFPIETGREAICSMIGEALPPLLVQKQAIPIRQHIATFE